MGSQKPEDQDLEGYLEYPGKETGFGRKVVAMAAGQPLQASLAVFGLVLLLLAGALFWRKGAQDPAVTIIPAADIEPEPGELVIHVAGAVVSPGVYRLAADSRVSDALAAAGGLAEKADRGWFDKSVNLAQKLADGNKIYVPFTGENLSLGTTAILGARAGAVNLNTASAGELVKLPKIGQILAKRIIEYRESHGGFTSIDELAKVSGISAKAVEELKPLVSL